MIKLDVVIISNPNAELCRNMTSYYTRMPEPEELGDIQMVSTLEFVFCKD